MDKVDVLLVEDDPNDVELILHVLQQGELAEGVHVVQDGKEALDFVFGKGAFAGRDTSRLPRLILLDLKLPHIHGHEVLKQVKDSERTKAIPVVILTSSDLDYDITNGYRLGVNSYIQKPVDYDQFRETVELIGRYWLKLNRRPVGH